MASFVANAGAKQVFGDIQKEWSSVTGKSRTDGGPPQNQIDWTNLNYPICFRIFHYDTDELPSAARRIVHPIHWLFLYSIVIFIVNFVDNIVLITGGVSFFRAVFSLLDFIILVPACGFVFYEGYRCVALSNSKKVFWYMIYQGVAGVIYLVFAFLPYGAMNGLGAIAFARSSTYEDVKPGIKTFWMICAGYECLLFLLAAAWAGFNMYRVKTFNPYHSQEARTAST
eukprot:Lankesteria_metandrocarpae@DN877_c0_g1_i1.p1